MKFYFGGGGGAKQDFVDIEQQSLGSSKDLGLKIRSQPPPPPQFPHLTLHTVSRIQGIMAWWPYTLPYLIKSLKTSVHVTGYKASMPWLRETACTATTYTYKPCVSDCYHLTFEIHV